jgi:hypothetical protein
LVIVVGLKMAHKTLIRTIEYSDETNWRGKAKVKHITYYNAEERVPPWVIGVGTVVLSIWIIAGIIL